MFDLDGHLKRHAGGKINECADCVEELGTEIAVKYTGTANEESGSFAISRHSSKEEREKFMKDLKNGVDLSR
tara:strand:+ start:168 stop:383 length:216 start_codon:yes stop_codon:yes gene_type:complete